MSIEAVEDIMSKIVMPVLSKESEFYHRHKLVSIYEKEIDGIE